MAQQNGPTTNGVRIRRTLSLANALQIQEYEAKERRLAPRLTRLRSDARIKDAAPRSDNPNLSVASWDPP
ncbi:hypothetical protein MTO96_031879 [Rhipicephalus appendiculatus]